MLRQGNSDKASECLSLGKYECINIPPAPAGGVKIEVTFRVDKSGILTVTGAPGGTDKKTV